MLPVPPYITLGQPEIYYIDHMLVFLNPHYKVVRFNISVQEVSGMQVLNSVQKLLP